jgi:hypothetical protein
VLHILSTAVIFTAVMPPDSSSEYDVHLLKSMQALSDLGNSMSTDVFISYCAHQTPGESVVNPKAVKEHLEQAGYSW